MRLQKIVASLVFWAALLVISVLPLAQTASAQIGPNYHWISVNPMAPGLIVQSPAGSNWTIVFLATWTYGSDYGRAIENATVPIEVRTINGVVLENLLPNTNATGFISFCYSSPSPNILTFVPTRLITEDGVEWNSSLLGGVNGFQSEPITIYWDSYDVSLISVDTATTGIARVTVNISYLMIPQEGLYALQPPGYLQYDYIFKYLSGADVKINRVTAHESSVPGVYVAETSSWLPTAYVLVEISQKGWPQTNQAFSYTHDANIMIWTPAVIILICVALLVASMFVFRGKPRPTFRSKGRGPTVGAILLIFSSFMSIYWTLVGFDGVLHGFSWLPLGIFGMIAVALGLAGGVMARIRKHFVLAVLAICFPLLENVVFVKFSFDIYQLAIPYTVAISAVVLSTLSGIFIGRSDDQFS